MSRLIKALKNLGAKMTTEDADFSGDTLEEVINEIADNHSIVLTSPDKSVWDISIANDGTISGTKRT